MIFNNDFSLIISAHAVEQFQDRIAPLSDEKAQAFIRDGIGQAVNIKTQPDGTSFRVRTRRPFPFEFRAFVVYDAEKLAYVVTTIVRGESNVTRKQKRKGETARGRNGEPETER